LEQQLFTSTSAARGTRLKLTPAGGQYWEGLARPSWELFVEEQPSQVIDGTCCFIFRSTNSKVLLLLGDAIAYWGRIRKEHQHASTLGEWRSWTMPWKTFDRGSELTVKMGTIGDIGVCNGILSCNNKYLRDLYMYFSSCWKLQFMMKVFEESD